MIEARALHWGPPGLTRNQLTTRVAPGTCAALGAEAEAGLTVLLIIGGLARPSSGQLLLDGRDVTADAATRRRDTFCVHPDLPRLPTTVAEYLSLAGAGRRASPALRTGALRLMELDAGLPLCALDESVRHTLGLAAALASAAPILLVHAPFADGTPKDHAQRRALLTEARHQGRTLVVTGLGTRDPLADVTIEVGR